MMHFTDVTGLLGSAIALTVISSKILGVLHLSRLHLAWILSAVFVVTLLPIGGLPLAGYLRGAIGDLSITSLLLLCAALLHTLRGWQTPPDRDKLLRLVVVTAAVLYPLALGWGDFDPYRLGYGNYWFLACLLGLALLAVWRRLPTVAFALALAVSAWSAGWYESTNLWDYLLDPLVAVYAAVAIIMQGIRRLRAK